MRQGAIISVGPSVNSTLQIRIMSIVEVVFQLFLFI